MKEGGSERAGSRWYRRLGQQEMTVTLHYYARSLVHGTNLVTRYVPKPRAPQDIEDMLHLEIAPTRSDSTSPGTVQEHFPGDAPQEADTAGVQRLADQNHARLSAEEEKIVLYMLGLVVADVLGDSTL